MSPAEQRRLRLKNDHQTMVNIKRPWLDWRVVRGEPPYVEEYILDARLRTIVGPAPDYRDKHVIRISMPSTYPHTSAPSIEYMGSPRPFHPNWFRDGRWCYGQWLVHESLGQHVRRMLQTLQYDAQITNVDSPANPDAKTWYLAKLQSQPSLFPCDRTELPDPMTSRLKIKDNIQKRFVLRED